MEGSWVSSKDWRRTWCSRPILRPWPWPAQKVWQIRVIVTHETGNVREARFKLNWDEGSWRFHWIRASTILVTAKAAGTPVSSSLVASRTR